MFLLSLFPYSLSQMLTCVSRCHFLVMPSLLCAPVIMEGPFASVKTVISPATYIQTWAAEVRTTVDILYFMAKSILYVFHWSFMLSLNEWTRIVSKCQAYSLLFLESVLSPGGIYCFLLDGPANDQDRSREMYSDCLRTTSSRVFLVDLQLTEW